MNNQMHLDLSSPDPTRLQPLPVVEAFGPTIQGEGPASGQLSAFLRLGGCNLACVWCDSAYTWDGGRYDLRKEISHLAPPEILALIPDVRNCIVTGGEPLLYQDRGAFIEVLQKLRSRGQRVHVETNGTIPPNEQILDLVDVFVVSPKLAHARAQKSRTAPALHPGWHAARNRAEVHLKVVVFSRDDVQETARMAQSFDWNPYRVWVMPEGTDAQTLARRWPDVCDWAIEAGLNASHRLHVLAWGDERGK